jgi:sulfate transport system permease protein
MKLRVAALAYLGVLVLVPLAMILYRTFEDGIGAFIESVTTPAAISAISLSLTIVAIVVPLNVVFGVLTALALARGRAGFLAPIVDLPFAVSPVIVGVAQILFWGNDGWLGGALPVIFSLPGMVLATTFVTLPFVVREVEPVLREIGTEQEEAAATLGANAFTIFRRITLPAIQWAVVYGVVLTLARALGEFGAVAIVSGGLAGRTQTMTQYVQAAYENGANETGAYAASVVLAAIAILTLVLMTVFGQREDSLGHRGA